jgi:histone H3/H4
LTRKEYGVKIMGETNIGSNGQAPDGATGQAPTPPTGQAPGSTSQNPTQPNSQAPGQTGENQDKTGQQLTQADFDRIVKELRAENATYRTKQKEIDLTQQRAEETRLQTEKKFEELATKRADTIKELEAKIAGYERKEKVLSILSAHKLPLDLEKSITGSTPEEMEESAKLLAKHVVAPPAPNTEGGNAGQKRGTGPGKPGQGTGQGQGQGGQPERKYTFQQPGEVAWPI